MLPVTLILNQGRAWVEEFGESPPPAVAIKYNSKHRKRKNKYNSLVGDDPEGSSAIIEKRDVESTAPNSAAHVESDEEIVEKMSVT
jgi:hypothetical protein